ncbi:hypothetical protein BJ875DRAFT_449785 [Amylocarpus encephaloides]|uniref:Uncharacterized protein n=1 Tax=Amylocarpus encephaloides TaxID=45428 RepID=A0A9P8C9I0_9HELO|nr:hypothetical protein BJ875DRAFT_449785 [Amylocarpus encephaloides]
MPTSPNMFSSSILAVLACAVTALAAPLSSNVLPGDLVPRAINTALPLSRPFCAPTDPGTCTLAVRWATEPTADGHELTLYNSHCRRIGDLSDVPTNPGEFNLYSELPYVVVGNSNFPYFKYKTGRYNDQSAGSSALKRVCEIGSGAAETPGVVNVCRFKCEAGGWDDARDDDPVF